MLYRVLNSTSKITIRSNQTTRVENAYLRILDYKKHIEVLYILYIALKKINKTIGKRAEKYKLIHLVFRVDKKDNENVCYIVKSEDENFKHLNSRFISSHDENKQ